MKRREFLSGVAGATVAPLAASAATSGGFRLRYVLASCMYGYIDLETILPEVKKTGARAIDIWPKRHGSRREQLDVMGEERFATLLKKYDVELAVITQYKLGPFGLKDEMRVAKRLGCRTIVTGCTGPRGLKGDALKTAMKGFVEKMKPHLDVAEQTDVTIAIENHAHNLMESPDGMKWLAELAPTPRLTVAFAPYHLPQDTKLLADLIRALAGRIQVFYAWQHGKGCMKKLPKADELLQMPGRGSLDFAPIVAALKKIRYAGWTSVFMHPVPRGIPILPTAKEVTAEIVRAHKHLQACLVKV